MQNDDQMVQKAAIEALIDIAEFSNVLPTWIVFPTQVLFFAYVMDNDGYCIIFQQEHFKNFYDFVMPDLKSILINANDKSNYKLRSIALQCISNVGLAVGKEKFRDDLEKVSSQLCLILLSHKHTMWLSDNLSWKIYVN